VNQMGWLTWLVVGGVAGWLASTIMRARLGLLMDTVAVTTCLDSESPQVSARY